LDISLKYLPFPRHSPVHPVAFYHAEAEMHRSERQKVRGTLVAAAKAGQTTLRPHEAAQASGGHLIEQIGCRAEQSERF
jgi:hypothetical protein